MKQIESKKDLQTWISYEMSRYNARRGIWGGIRRLIPISEKDIVIKHQIRLRKTEYYNNTGKKIRAVISKVMLNRLQNRTMLHIPVNTCGMGLLITHVGPVLINWHARIGENCIININTALVATNKEDTAPEIGDDVVIGVGAVLIGGIKIANGVVIGANSTVTKSFLEEGIVLAGSPAKNIHSVQ